MKNSIILLIGVIGILCSCSEVDVTDYSSDNFIQFAKAAKDSTVFSFAYDQTMSAGTVKLKLNCIANLSTENRTFGVRLRRVPPKPVWILSCRMRNRSCWPMIVSHTWKFS